MEPIRVVVNGATGKMGAETVAAVCREDDLTLPGATCHKPRGSSLPLHDGSREPHSTDPNTRRFAMKASPSALPGA